MLKIYIINYLHMSKICTFEIIIIYFLKYLSYFASGYLQCPQNKVPFYTNSIQHSKHGPSSCISQYNLKLVCLTKFLLSICPTLLQGVISPGPEQTEPIACLLLLVTSPYLQSIQTPLEVQSKSEA